MDFRTSDGRIYQRRMVARSERGLRAAVAEVQRRGYVDYFAADLGTFYAVYFDARG